MPVVVVDVAGVVDQAHVQRGHGGEPVDLRAVHVVEVVEHLQAQLGVVDDLVNRRQSVVAVQESLDVGRRQTLVDSAGNGRDAVHPFAEDRLDDLLTPFAQPDNTFDQFGVGFDQSDEVALFGCGVDAEQHFGHHQVEVRCDVRLQHLRVVPESAHLDRGGGQRGPRRRPDPDHVVECLGAGEVVADEADSADALHQHRRLPVRVPLDEALIAAELHHVQLGVDDVVVVVEFDHDLAVPLDSGDRIDHDGLAGGHGHRSPFTRSG